MSRTILMLTLLAVSVVASPVVLRSGDPALDGKDHLISDHDFRAILVVARARLATIRPRPSIYRVTIVSATEADAWYGDPNDIE